MIDEHKKKLFSQGFPPWLANGCSESWRREYQLCDCESSEYPCYDCDCPVRGKNERFPHDAGGAGQCLRLAQAKSRFSFRIEGGTVITIPDEIIKEIIRETLEQVPIESA